MERGQSPPVMGVGASVACGERLRNMKSVAAAGARSDHSDLPAGTFLP